VLLGDLRRVFVVCGLSASLLVPLRMVWPDWRLYDLVIAWVAAVVWKFALRSGALREVYNELDRAERAARNLQATRDEAEQASNFLRAVAHDLKTPLNGLMLQADLAELSLHADDQETIRLALAEIKEGARRTDDLLESFLELARLDRPDEVLRIESFRVDLLLRDVVERFQPGAAAKGLGLGFDALPAVTLLTDRAKVERVVAKLLENAVKFCHEGAVRLALDLHQTALTIHVTDTGVGIAAEHQNRIFDEFVQVGNIERDSQKGHGLGLAIARRLARQLNGHLSVESRAGHGSRFSLTLPRPTAPS
jgi:signal transduction histidine kinase